MLEDLGIEFDSDNGEVQEMLPLPNINSIILKKVIDWCRYHVNDEEPMEEDHGENKYTAQRNNKKLKALYDQSLQIKSAIPNPLIWGVIHDCEEPCKSVKKSSRRHTVGNDNGRISWGKQIHRSEKQ